MKILMVHDCAHVGHNLSLGLQKQGIDCSLINFKIGESFLGMARRIRKVDCDLIHAHYFRSPVYSAYMSGRPFIIHCHGSDIRKGLNFKQKIAILKSQNVLVSTPDLKKQYPKFTYLPNIVGEQFKQQYNIRKKDWVYIPKKEDGNPDLFLPQISADFNIRIHIPPNKISYNKMPEFISQFEGLVERRNIPSLSVCGLESLKCGLKVLTWDNKIIEGLPKEHETKNVIKKLTKIYELILK